MTKIIKHYYLDEDNPESIEIMVDITEESKGLRAYSFNMNKISEVIRDETTYNTSIMFLISFNKDENGRSEVDTKVSRNGLRSLSNHDVSKWDRCILVTEENNNMDNDFVEYLYDKMNEDIRKSDRFKLFNDESKRTISNLEYIEKLRMENKVKDVKFFLRLRMESAFESANNNIGNELAEINELVKKNSHELTDIENKIKHSVNKLKEKEIEIKIKSEELEEGYEYVDLVNEDLNAVKIKLEAAKEELRNVQAKLDNKKAELIRTQEEINKRVRKLGIPYKPKAKEYQNSTIYHKDNKFKIYKGATVRENNSTGFTRVETDLSFSNLSEAIEFITDGRGGQWSRVTY